MSIVEVKVPELSESVSEASLIEWKKKVHQFGCKFHEFIVFNS